MIRLSKGWQCWGQHLATIPVKKISLLDKLWLTWGGSGRKPNKNVHALIPHETPCEIYILSKLCKLHKGNFTNTNQESIKRTGCELWLTICKSALWAGTLKILWLTGNNFALSKWVSWMINPHGENSYQMNQLQMTICKSAVEYSLYRGSLTPSHRDNYIGSFIYSMNLNIWQFSDIIHIKNLSSRVR